MNSRHTASTITDAQLDALYEELARAQRVAMRALDWAAPDQTTPSGRAGLRDEIAAALEAADYSGTMRRGDLADSVMPVLYQAWPWLRAEAEDPGPAATEATGPDCSRTTPNNPTTSNRQP